MTQPLRMQLPEADGLPTVPDSQAFAKAPTTSSRFQPARTICTSTWQALS
jgi:hypothetical protein